MQITGFNLTQTANNQVVGVENIRLKKLGSWSLNRNDSNSCFTFKKLKVFKIPLKLSTEITLKQFS